MSEKRRQPHKRGLRRRLRRLLAQRSFRIYIISVCVAMMLACVFSIVHSLRLMREYAAASLPPVQEAIPTPEPTLEPAPIPTPVPTPLPTPLPFPTPVSPYGWKENDGVRRYLLRDGSAATGLHTIDGKLYYFDLNGRSAGQLGVDVSFYNKGIDWPAVKAAGIDFAIIRLGYRGWETGLLHEDSCFRQNLCGAKAAGIKLGVYFFSTAATGPEGAEEAAFVLETLNGFPLELPVFLDVEESGNFPFGRSDRISNVRRYEVVKSFCRTIESGGYRAGLYSYQNFIRYNKLDYRIVGPYPFWFASYTRYNRLPDFDQPYDYWQFTSRGVVGGIRGIVDMNAIFE